MLKKNTVLLVGMEIELKNVFIYETDKIVFKKAFYYNNYELSDLPDWITFTTATGVLRMNVYFICFFFKKK